MTPEESALRTQARRLMLHLARSRTGNPVTDADRRTSMCDARIGLCLAVGVAAEDIDPASGFDYSAESYASVRASWRSLAEQHGFSRFYDGPAYEAVLSAWRARRPDLVVANWIEEKWMRD